MADEVESARRDGDTLGGVVEVLVDSLPPGLGSHVHWDRRLDSRLAAALMGIQAIKGVEVGDGFELARTRGSLAHDEILPDGPGRVRRASGRSGGTEGGMSTGEVLRVRAAMKPIATVPKALRTVDVATGEEARANNQRSDVCAVPAAGVVAEAMVALVVADAVLEKFGGDSVAQTRRSVRGLPSAASRPSDDPASAVLRLCQHSTGPLPEAVGRIRPVVVLVGVPGAGKSTVGRALAERLGVGFRDTDADVESSTGRAIADIFVQSGEPEFRRLEAAAVATALREHAGVLALGGGAVMDPGTRGLLAGGPVVWLRVGLATASHRAGLSGARPGPAGQRAGADEGPDGQPRPAVRRGLPPDRGHRLESVAETVESILGGLGLPGAPVRQPTQVRQPTSDRHPAGRHADDTADPGARP